MPLFSLLLDIIKNPESMQIAMCMILILCFYDQNCQALETNTCEISQMCVSEQKTGAHGTLRVHWEGVSWQSL